MSSTTWGHNRGRDAKSPTEIPASGWKDTLMRVKNEVKTDRLSMVSAAMAYYILFAFVPAITSTVLIYAWVSDPKEIAGHLDKVSPFIPQEIQTMLNEQLGNLSSTAPTALGVSAIVALAIALWSASKGSKAIMDAMNIIYDQEEKRGFIKLNLMALGMTLLGAVIGVLAIGAIIVVPVVINLFNLGGTTEIIATAVSWFALLALFTFYLSFTYRFAPSRDKAKWKWVSWGSVIAAVLFAAASALFSWYAKEFGNFNKTYGSLGAIIVLMMWFYISSFVVLLGGEINAELEHQTMRDTTKGSEKPMGSRGATMADTVGESYDKKERPTSSGARISDSQDHHRNLWH